MEKMLFLLIIILFIVVIICLLAIAYNIGCISGMRKIMAIDEEGDKEFKQMILDFVSEKYVKKDGE